MNTETRLSNRSITAQTHVRAAAFAVLCSLVSAAGLDTRVCNQPSLERIRIRVRVRVRGQHHCWSALDIGRCIHLSGSTRHRPSGSIARSTECDLSLA